MPESSKRAPARPNRRGAHRRLQCERLEERWAPALAVTSLDVLTPADLVATILGSGVTVNPASITYQGTTGADSSAGNFMGGTGIIGFERGIVLSTGRASDVIGPNTTTGITTANGTGGDADLAPFTTSALSDATVLEFDFVPTFSTLTFSYVFSSEEYNEFVTPNFNDVFGFFVNGVNQALLPTTTTGTNVVSINNVNLTSNSNYYIDNDSGGRDTQMDGLTVVLTVSAAVNPGVSNHIKMAIADAFDTSYDSNVFIEANSFGGAVQVNPSGGSTDVAEGGVTDTYTLRLTEQPTADVTISIDGGPQLQVSNDGVNFTQTNTVTFTTTNWNVAQTVTVRAVDDAAVEANHTGTITQTASSTDSRYNGLAVASIVANIADNDHLPGTVTVTPTGGSTGVTEGAGTDTYSLVLGLAPNSNVTITLNPGTQVTVSPLSLVFTPADWDTPRIVTVTAVDDAVMEGPHAATIIHTLTTTDNRYVNTTVASMPVSISDNDFGRVIFTPGSGSLAVLEGTSRTYTAVLSAAPTSNVTVNLSAGAGLSLSAGSLIFTPADWNVAQIVTATATDNSSIDGNRDTTIGHAVVTGDPIYAGVSAATLAVNIVDDDNTLIVTGGDSVDQVSLLFSGNLLQVIHNKKSTFHPTTYSQVLVLAGGGSDTIQVLTPSIPVAILGGLGTDKVQIDGQASANVFVVDSTTVGLNGRNVELGDVETVLLNGKNGSDLFAVLATPSFSMTFQGSAGQDRLSGPIQNSTWKITGADAGNLNGNLAFGAVENLMGGPGADNFVFAAAKTLSGQIDGGGGANVLDFSAYKTAVTANLQTRTATGLKSFLQISSIVAGTGSDKLIGANVASTWNISSANAGDVGGVTFRNFENLTGGTQNDDFLFAAGQTLKGKIDGGGGSDTLDYTAYLTALTINLQTKLASGTGGWLNVEQFRGGAGTDTFVGSNKLNAWSLTGTGLGSLTGGVGFQSFENLYGGTLADTFTMIGSGEWLGLLDGTAGSDTLVASTGSNYTTTGPNAGTLNGRTFKSVERRQ